MLSTRVKSWPHSCTFIRPWRTERFSSTERSGVKDTRAPERKKCSLPPGITRNATVVSGRGDTVRRSGRGQQERRDGLGNGEIGGGEAACRAMKSREGGGRCEENSEREIPSQRGGDPRKHPDAAVQLSSQNMQCRSWGLLVRLFLRRSTGEICSIA